MSVFQQVKLCVSDIFLVNVIIEMKYLRLRSTVKVLRSFRSLPLDRLRTLVTAIMTLEKVASREARSRRTETLDAPSNCT
jgi:hypothetical protein